jgi:hypothetical protein
MKQITIYICDKCGEEFRKRSFCQRHEAECKAQNCNICKHGIRVLDNYYRCEMFLFGKDCKFEAKEMRM